MKSSFIVIVAFLFVGCASLRQTSSRTRNDIADAKAAFATLIEYQKTDDIRSLDLFSQNCPVTFTVVNGNTQRTVVWPQDAFLESLRKQLALKLGNRDTYEDVKFSQEGTNVLVTAMVHYADSGKRGPFSAVYVRDKTGILKIQELKVTVFTDENLK